MKIFIATDHRGVDIEDKIVSYLTEMGLEVIRTKIKHNPTDDYPDFAFDVANNVLKNKDSIGILICGTGIGMSIAANKVKGIRAARCVSKNDAFYAKNHNAANIICLGMNDNTYEEMIEMIDTFTSTQLPSEEKHLRRAEKIINYESGSYNEL